MSDHFHQWELYVKEIKNGRLLDHVPYLEAAEALLQWHKTPGDAEHHAAYLQVAKAFQWYLKELREGRRPGDVATLPSPLNPHMPGPGEGRTVPGAAYC